MIVIVGSNLVSKLLMREIRFPKAILRSNVNVDNRGPLIYVVIKGLNFDAIWDFVTNQFQFGLRQSIPDTVLKSETI